MRGLFASGLPAVRRRRGSETFRLPARRGRNRDTGLQVRAWTGMGLDKDRQRLVLSARPWPHLTAPSDPSLTISCASIRPGSLLRRLFRGNSETPRNWRPNRFPSMPRRSFPKLNARGRQNLIPRSGFPCLRPGLAARGAAFVLLGPSRSGSVFRWPPRLILRMRLGSTPESQSGGS